MRTSEELGNLLVRAAYGPDGANEIRLLAQCVADGEAGGDVGRFLNGSEGYGGESLRAAARTGNVACVDILLGLGVPVDAADCDERTALMEAIQSREEACVRRLVQHGAQLEQRDEDGRTALMAAVSFGFEAGVRVLLFYGANPNATRAEDGRTPLIMAAARRLEGCLQLLLAHGAHVNAVSKRGESALYALVENGMYFASEDVEARQQTVRLVQLLLKHGASVDCEDISGIVPLDLCVSDGLLVASPDMELFSLLVRSGADLNRHAHRTQTPMAALMRIASARSSAFIDVEIVLVVYGCSIGHALKTCLLLELRQS
ncbi:Ankyrin repeat domain-containing protein 50 [Porphyridium purpureum]|uniref:Ankyrin repeat domain-containing protein 50 n=1 Tax=Porphyridium purpureum TaxID=35688 RepID=A0A5J4YL56_PORPP|nr:Ankyrin repeat domain-containing protein 50 [Porphyridium purpureum]|eukprot:POR6143..scf249_10